MSNAAYVGSKLKKFDSSDRFDPYTRVIIQVSEDLEYVAGTDTGRTLTIVNPYGTQEMADNLVASLRGFQYQPYEASGAYVDPAAELGDAITVRGVYSGICSYRTKFGRNHVSEVSAPTEKIIDHEYPYIPSKERQITRNLYNLTTELKIQAGLISAEVEERKSDVEKINSQLTVQAGEIAAKVSKTEGATNTFGWSLQHDNWQVFANGTTILKATQGGLEVNGKIVATSGKIGGFDILSDRLSYNNQVWGGTNTKGIYIGPSGIQLGRNFSVDSSGNLHAYSGTFDGTVKAGNIAYGEDAGYFSGSGLESHSVSGGRIGYNTISTSNTSGGINSSLGYANFSNDVFNGNDTAAWIKCSTIVIDGKRYSPKSILYKNWNGDNSSMLVLTTQD